MIVKFMTEKKEKKMNKTIEDELFKFVKAAGNQILNKSKRI